MSDSWDESVHSWGSGFVAVAAVVAVASLKHMPAAAPATFLCNLTCTLPLARRCRFQPMQCQGRNYQVRRSRLKEATGQDLERRDWICDAFSYSDSSAPCCHHGAACAKCCPIRAAASWIDLVLFRLEGFLNHFEF